MRDIVLLNLLKIRKIGGKIVNFAAIVVRCKFYIIAPVLRRGPHYLQLQLLPWG